MRRSQIFLNIEMSNYKFRFSAMIPSEWFHKFKNMAKSRRKKPSSESKSILHSSSSYFSNRPHTSARNSLLKIQGKRKTIYKSSPSSLYLNKRTCPASNQTKQWSKTHHLSVENASRRQKKHQKILVSKGRRRSSANSQGIKLRGNSPKIKVLPLRSKSRSKSRQVVDSFAVIKRSLDPKKDFRESMVEMIRENNMRGSKDLENLLTCYLTLNPIEYHDLIINVFVEIWFEIINSIFASK